MKIIVPMAGRGSRLRPHTLTTPKPLIPVAGMPIVERLVRDIAAIVKQPITDIGFVLGDPAFFGDDVVDHLTKSAKDLDAVPHIFRQNTPLGTGHAIMCAEPILSGPAVVAYADTLIRADFHLDPEVDAAIWVKQVDNPQAYGVVQLNDNGDVKGMVEKPQQFVSDMAAIGVYYFKEIGQLSPHLLLRCLVRLPRLNLVSSPLQAKSFGYLAIQARERKLTETSILPAPSRCRHYPTIST